MNKIIFSSKTDQWATPQIFFDELDHEFDFNLDACADESNHKCDHYYTAQQNGLLQNWGGTEYSAIHHMAKTSANGLRNATRRDKKKTPLFVS